jgi:hypothetical protein
MNNQQVKEEIKLIREMIEKSKKSYAESWRFFLLWGILVILGIIGMYGLVFLKKFNLIWLNWILFMGIGVIIQIFLIVRREKTRETKTYIEQAVIHLSFACGIAFLFTGFILPLLKVYPFGVIPIMVSVIAGVIIFTFGGIYEWNFLKWCGVIWWLGALGMVFIHSHYRSLAVALLIIVGYLVPGFILRNQYLKKKRENDQ